MGRRKQKASLDGVYDKIRRAQRHLDDLCALAQPFDASNGERFVGEVRRDGRKHIYRWNNPPALDPDIELITGDLVHNLRSALDHLAYQLVVLNKQVPNGRTAFPILDGPPGRRSRWNGRTPTAFRVPGVSSQASALIEEIQPYKGTDAGRRLSQLGMLDNIDKHRHLLATLSAVHFASTSWFGEDPPYGEPHITFLHSRPIHGEIAVAVVWPKPRKDLDPHLDFQTLVSIDERVGRAFRRCPVISLMQILLTVVEDDVIQKRFAPLFAPE